MIVRSHRVHTFKLLLACQGSIVPAIAWKIFVAALVGVAAELIIIYEIFGPASSQMLQFTMGPFTSLGVAISLFLGFYNNAAYSRWWEARGIYIKINLTACIYWSYVLTKYYFWEKYSGYWGRQIINLRNLTRFLILLGVDDNYPICNHSNTKQYVSQGNSFEQTNPDTDNQTSIFNVNTEICQLRSNSTIQLSSWRHDLVRLAVAQTHALRAQLRPNCKFDGKTTALDDRNRFLTTRELETVVKPSRNPTNAILLHAGKILGNAYRQQASIDSYILIYLSDQLNSLSDIQTSCEKILNTPMPLAYSLLIQRTTVLYTFFLPFAIAEEMGWWTPFFTAIVAYTFFGLDELARQIQEPFGDEPMCLALSAMSRTIEIDALEALGHASPSPIQRQGKILM